MDLEFSNKIDRLGRKPILWIYQRGQMHRFDGKDIKGAATVIDEKQGVVEVRSGKKSFSKYRLKLGDGAIPCILISSEHGRLWPDQTLELAHARFATQFKIKNLSRETFIEAIAAGFPLTYERMKAGESNPWLRSL